MQDYIELIAKLKDTYRRITGIEIHEMRHNELFFAFCQGGYTEQDLKDVLHWIDRENKKNSYQYSLRISNLIGDLDTFDERRAEAQRRKPAARSAGQRTVDSFRGYQEPLPTNNTMHISEVMRKAAGGT